MNTENSKTSQLHRFRLTLADKLNLKDPNKNKNISIYCTWKNIKSAYNNNKFKISAPTWDDGVTILIYLMNHILFKIFDIISDTLLKKTKLQQIIPL